MQVQLEKEGMMSLVFEQERLKRQLAASATEVLETMFFSSVQELPQEPLDATRRERIGAYLNFHGACAGRLALSLEKNAARNLATSFFGETVEGTKDEDCSSVMAELTNIVCGAMLSHLDRDSIFCLDSPEALGDGEDAEGHIIRLLQLEDGLLRLAFSLDGETGAH